MATRNATTAWPLTGPYIAKAREAIEQGRLTAGRTGPHHLAGGTPVSVDPDPARARDAVRAAVAAELAGPTGSIHIEPLGIADEVKQLLAAAGSVERFAADLPDRWIDQLVSRPRVRRTGIGARVARRLRWRPGP